MEIERMNSSALLLLEEAESYNSWIYHQMKPFLKGRILEIGCGIGNLTGFLLNEGEVVASDVVENYLVRLKEKFEGHRHLVDTVLWDLREEPPRQLSSGFDTIVCSNVLEHVEEDDRVLRQCHNLLSARGHLILVVPAMKVLYNELDRSLGHFRRYGREELAQKLNRSGFRVSHLAYFNLLGMFGWFFNGTILRKSLLPKGQVRLFNRWVPFLAMLERILPKWIGQSLLAVGEKR